MNEKRLKEASEIGSQYFIRLRVLDQTGTFSAITALFAEFDVSFEKLLQLPVEGEELAEIIVVTHKTSKQTFDGLIERLKNVEVVESVESSYCVEGGN